MSKSDNNKSGGHMAVQQQLHVGGKKLSEKEIKEQIESALNVPVAIMKRVNALKNLQVRLLNVESKFYEELHLLECKYQAQYDELYEKRKVVVTGDVEPTDEEAKWALDDADNFGVLSSNGAEDTKSPLKAIENSSDVKEESGADLVKDLKAKMNLSDVGSNAKNIKGVPDFWLQTFKSAELIQDMIQEYDEPLLRQLYDLRVRLHDTKPYGYTLEFYFNDNDFFTNKVLTKTYDLRMDLDPKDPFSYEGPDIYKCKGCTIDWKKGKNVTVRLVKKKQKHKQSGSIRVVTKEIKQDSFFNYFDTPKQPTEGESAGALVKASAHDDTVSGGEEVDEDGLLAADFEIGHFFKERIIPKATLYFTGEINDDYDDYDDDDDEDEDGDDDDDEDDEDDDDDDDDDEDDNDDAHDLGHKHGHGHGAHGHQSNNKNNNNKNNSKQSGPQNHHQKSPSSRQHQNSGGDPKNQPPECKQN